MLLDHVPKQVIAFLVNNRAQRAVIAPYQLSVRDSATPATSSPENVAFLPIPLGQAGHRGRRRRPHRSR